IAPPRSRIVARTRRPTVLHDQVTGVAGQLPVFYGPGRTRPEGDHFAHMRKMVRHSIARPGRDMEAIAAPPRASPDGSAIIGLYEDRGQAHAVSQFRSPRRALPWPRDRQRPGRATLDRRSMV